MNKNIMIFAILMAGGIAMAFLPVSDPYLDTKFTQTYCGLGYMRDIGPAALSYDSSYSSEITSIRSDLISSGRSLQSYCYADNRASFNQEYQSEFVPLLNQMTAIYFKAAFNYAVMNPGSLPMILNEYLGFQMDRQDCIENNRQYCGAV